MKYKLLEFKFREVIAKFRRKDPMPILLEKYKYLGANIPDNSGIRAFSPITSPEPFLITVGAKTTISVGVRFCTHDNAIIKSNSGVTDLVGPITIGENCFIGMNVILLPGIQLANNTIVGAGSIVTRSFTEEGIVIAGNPAKKICTTEEYFNKGMQYAFDFKGQGTVGRKQLILENPHKWLRK